MLSRKQEREFKVQKRNDTLAYTYDMENTSTKMIILNFSKQEDNRIRGYESGSKFHQVSDEDYNCPKCKYGQQVPACACHHRSYKLSRGDKRHQQCKGDFLAGGSQLQSHKSLDSGTESKMSQRSRIATSSTVPKLPATPSGRNRIVSNPQSKTARNTARSESVSDNNYRRSRSNQHKSSSKSPTPPLVLTSRDMSLLQTIPSLNHPDFTTGQRKSLLSLAKIYTNVGPIRASHFSFNNTSYIIPNMSVVNTMYKRSKSVSNKQKSGHTKSEKKRKASLVTAVRKFGDDKDATKKKRSKIESDKSDEDMINSEVIGAVLDTYGLDDNENNGNNNRNNNNGELKKDPDLNNKAEIEEKELNDNVSKEKKMIVDNGLDKDNKELELDVEEKNEIEVENNISQKFTEHENREEDVGNKKENLNVCEDGEVEQNELNKTEEMVDSCVEKDVEENDAKIDAKNEVENNISQKLTENENGEKDVGAEVEQNNLDKTEEVTDVQEKNNEGTINEIEEKDRVEDNISPKLAKHEDNIIDDNNKCDVDDDIKENHEKEEEKEEGDDINDKDNLLEQIQDSFDDPLMDEELSLFIKHIIDVEADKLHEKNKRAYGESGANNNELTGLKNLSDDLKQTLNGMKQSDKEE